MKTLTVKFTRKPQFTPANLTERELSRIEWLVKAHFLRSAQGWNEHNLDIFGGQDAVKDITSKWFAPIWRHEIGQGCDGEIVKARKARHDARVSWLANSPNAQRYYSTCWNYLLAIAKRNGEVIEPERHSRAYYGERYSGYN